MPRRWSRLWRHHVYALRWFAGQLPEPPPADDRIWRVLSREETASWVRNRLTHAVGREMNRVALENRHALLTAEIDGKPVAHRWVGTGWVYLTGPIWCLVHFPEGTAYFYDIQVEPAHRGRGIGRAGVASGLAYARAAGLTSCALWIRRSNAPSLRNWSGLGVPCFDATRVVASYRGLWLPRSPWRRLGVSQVRLHPPSSFKPELVTPGNESPA